MFEKIYKDEYILKRCIMNIFTPLFENYVIHLPIHVIFKLNKTLWSNPQDEESYIGDALHMPSLIHRNFIVESGAKCKIQNCVLINYDYLPFSLSPFLFLLPLGNEAHTIFKSI
jgi:hypothetical protein